MKQSWGQAASEQLWSTLGANMELRPWSEASRLLQLYVRTLEHASSRRNLISSAQRSHDRIWDQVFDCLNALHLLTHVHTHKCIDIGSGNGLPALPLSIALPRTSFVLVEQSAWKADYLVYASSLLNLDNTRVLNRPITSRLIVDENADVVTLRALIGAVRASRVSWLKSLSCPFLVFATLKTEEDWNNTLGRLSIRALARHEYTLESKDARRVILKFRRD